MRRRLENRHTLLGVTGSIAAYKACEILRILKPAGLAVLQFVGGAPSAPEIMEIMQNVWDEVLAEPRPSNLLRKILVEDIISADMMENYLAQLGIERFEIAWRKNMMRVGMGDVPKLLDFLNLVGGFWRHDLDEELAIENLSIEEVLEKIGKGEIEDAKTLAGMMLLQIYLGSS